MVRYIPSLVYPQRMTNSIPLGKPDPFNLVRSLGGRHPHEFSHLVLAIQMFQTPALIVMSIAATRMYRSLTDFTSTSGYYASRLFRCSHAKRDRCRSSLHTSQIQSGRTMKSDPRRISSAPIPLDRLEVAVHRSSEEYPQANMGQYVSYGTYSADSQSHDKPLVLSLSNDLENGVKKG